MLWVPSMDDHRETLLMKINPWDLTKHFIILGWLVVSTPLKNMKVSWDYSSQYMDKIKVMFQTTNQYWLIAG